MAKKSSKGGNATKAGIPAGQIGTFTERYPMTDQSFNIHGVMPEDLQKDYQGELQIIGGTPSGPFDTHRDETYNCQEANANWGAGRLGSDNVPIGETEIL
jgi:hypothetical protein